MNRSLYYADQSSNRHKDKGSWHVSRQTLVAQKHPPQQRSIEHVQKGQEGQGSREARWFSCARAEERGGERKGWLMLTRRPAVPSKEKSNREAAVPLAQR